MVSQSFRETAHKHGNSFWADAQRAQWPRDRATVQFLGRAVLELGQAMFGTEWNDNDPSLPLPLNEDVLIPAVGADHNFIVRIAQLDAAKNEQKRCGARRRYEAVCAELARAIEDRELELYHLPPHGALSDTIFQPVDSHDTRIRKVPIGLVEQAEEFDHLFHFCSIDPLDPFKTKTQPLAVSQRHGRHPLFVDLTGLRLLLDQQTAGKSPATIADDTAGSTLPTTSEAIETSAGSGLVRVSKGNKKKSLSIGAIDKAIAEAVASGMSQNAANIKLKAENPDHTVDRVLFRKKFDVASAPAKVGKVPLGRPRGGQS